MSTTRPRRHTRTLLAVLLLAGIALAARAGAEPVAILVQLEGAVELRRAGEEKAAAAVVGTPLAVGDRLVVPEGGRAVVLYRTGKTETATTTVEVIDPERSEDASLFRQTVATLAQVATTDAKSDPNRQGMIRPIAGAAVPVSPRNGITVSGTRPTFTWLAVAGAEAYTIQIRREGAVPLRFNTDADTSWSWPADQPPLLPGESYQWTVAANGGRPAPPQSFRVISAAEYDALASRLALILDLGLEPMEDGLFLTALAYRDAGLFYETRAALVRLERKGVATGRPLRLLRGETFDALGMLEEAAREFALADGEPIS